MKAAKAAPVIALPRGLEPQLATLVQSVPPGEWLYEIKFDGYRILTRVDGQDVRIITRGGLDWTARFPTLHKHLQGAKLPRGWYDGEIVVLDETGRPSFNALQNAIEGKRNREIVYFLFDAPWLGQDLREVAVEERRRRLQEVLPPGGEHLRFSDELAASGRDLLASACKMGLEGIIGKRRGSRYTGERSADWIKLKCVLRQEFVIGGYARKESTGTGLSALLVGYYDSAGVLHYAGKVGTGFTGEQMGELQRRIDSLNQRERPFAEKTSYDKRAVWCKPQLVCEVEYREWNEGQHLRHTAFKGLRSDKPAREVRREGDSRSAASTKPPSIKVSNPDRVVDQSSGATKIDLVRYYEAVAAWMLPHLADRPVSFVRAPSGIAGQLFFQKHLEHSMPGVEVLDAKLWPGHEGLLVVNSLQALVTAAQMNVVEFHTWNSVASAINQPDRVIFDLDPGEGVTWERIVTAAQLVRTMLDELGLQAWLKTSGGKGLHVVVPLEPTLPYERVKAFSQAVVQHMAKTIPDWFVAKAGASNRVGRIFVDYLRNGLAQTTAAAFSARARAGLGVSMTISWEQLAKVTGGAHWTIANAVRHLQQRTADPWEDYGACRQSLDRALTILKVR